jgi:hypothetical protein
MNDNSIGHAERTAARLDADANDAARMPLGQFERNLAAEAYQPNLVAEDLVRINDSGIVPTEFKVLVLPDESETQIKARRSNIMVPDAYAAMYAHGSVTGRIIAMSPAAFSYHEWPEGCRLPLVGERIVFARYAGMLVQGKPGLDAKGREEPREYRLLNDKDIAAVLEF